MARRRRRQFGGSAEIHRERAKGTVREIRRLSRVIRSHLKAPPDCESLSSFLRALAYQEGAYDIDRFEAGGRLLQSRAGRATRSLARKFDAVCVVRPKSEAARRKIRAVWR